MTSGGAATFVGNPNGPQPAYQQQSPDQTGQVAPSGMKPRVTATLWEDEGCMCFQIEAKGICVARRDGKGNWLCLFQQSSTNTRSDNHMINGTKLLNVAGMTRGRRDGILKSEKSRAVVKIGPMHLKGVWYVCNTSDLTPIADMSVQDPLRSRSRFCKQREDH